jgi:hypothetical protein
MRRLCRPDAMNERPPANRIARRLPGFAIAYAVCAVAFLGISLTALIAENPGQGEIHVVMVVLASLMSLIGPSSIIYVMRDSRRRGRKADRGVASGQDSTAALVIGLPTRCSTSSWDFGAGLLIVRSHFSP